MLRVPVPLPVRVGRRAPRRLQVRVELKLPYGSARLATRVRGAVGVAQQGGAHRHVAEGDLRHGVQVWFRVGHGLPQLDQQRRAGWDDDLAQRPLAALL